ncbi:hAT dimerization domain-containing protein / transposase-like protein [Perilla frutescens var. frutescens]|nr:hAT dimerization domain-containing protein / transposase-like protein [Perilla frutescens var. frutescens]
MGRMARSCIQSLLKLVNSGLGMAGIAMIVYSLWMFRVWLRNDESLQAPVPWFIYTILGLGAALCVITCSGHIAAETANGCCLYIYMAFVFMLFVVEAAVTADVFLNHNWQEDFPTDSTGNLDQLKEFVKDNFDICKWVGLTVVAVQPMASDCSNMASTESGDPTRKYGTPDPANKVNWTCLFCTRVLKGGSFRMKQHLVGGFRNVKKCTKCPKHVSVEIKNYMMKKAEAKQSSQMMPQHHSDSIDDDVDEEDMETLGTCSSKPKSIPPMKKMKGPLDVIFGSNPRGPRPPRSGSKNERKTIYDACDKACRDKALDKIANFFYDNGIPFNAATTDSYKEMIEEIGRYGPGLVPPSMYELRVPLLRKKVDDVNLLMLENKKEWAIKGCSILSDGWRDSVASKDIVNFLVNSPRGSVFLRSIDVSNITKDAYALVKMFNDIIEEVGESNIVQVVTDNASNYVRAGQILMTERKHLYWTPCAAHCLDLMLEDIEKLPKIKNALKKCIFMNGYIYNHVSLVNMMRRFTNQRNLHRPAVTRFATSFITLAQYHKQKSNLRKMVTSEEWNSSRWQKDAGGKKIATYILQDIFWRNVLYALKLVGPLVKVLRMVDGERKPPMGYIYEAMDRAKEAIAKSFSMNEEHYKEAFEFIDRRWECQLHHPLHAAGYFLNPEYYYANPEQVGCVEVEKGLYDCVERLSPDIETQDKIMHELDAYKNASGLFGNAMAIRHRKLHTKKRNRLAQTRLNDLVYVKYNRTLQRRYERKDTIDPILLDDIDESNEWLIGKMNEDNEVEDLVFDGDDLTWNVVSRATGADDPPYSTRRASKTTTTKTIASSSSRVDKGKGVASNSRRLLDEIEDEDVHGLEDFEVEMEMEEEEDIGEEKDDKGDGDYEFYDDDY